MSLLSGLGFFTVVILLIFLFAGGMTLGMMEIGPEEFYRRWKMNKLDIKEREIALKEREIALKEREIEALERQLRG